jgi:hypothetical protein
MVVTVAGICLGITCASTFVANTANAIVDPNQLFSKLLFVIRTLIGSCAKQIRLVLQANS